MLSCNNHVVYTRRNGMLTWGSVQGLVDKWSEASEQATEFVPNLPLAVMLLEAFELAQFIEHYWQPNADDHGLPGLSEAVGPLFTPTIAQELRELALAVTELQAKYNALVLPLHEAPVERGEFILSELQKALAFLFDDGVSDVKDRELARLKESHDDRSTQYALALSIEGFAHYAHKHRAKLKQLPGFDVALIDEALIVAQAIRETRSVRRYHVRVDERQATRALRARLTRLLHEKMAAARRVIRYAFRARPDVVARATSQYRREKRARQRKGGSRGARSFD